MNHYLTFDYGTTSIKACLIDAELKMLAQCIEEYDLITDGGRIEMNSEDYWDAMCRAVAHLKTEVSLEQVAAICITTQGETMIPVDAQGNALSNAVVWLDSRAGEQAEEIAAVISPEALYEQTGVTDLGGALPLSKLLWFREQQPEVYQRAHRFLLLEDYLVMRLTGQFVTEPSLQTSTGWYSLQTGGYMTELLRALSLDEAKLPQILACGECAGALRQEAAQALGLRENVRVVMGAMDQIAAAIGGGGLQPGILTATIGTAMVMTCSYDASALPQPPMIVYRGYAPQQRVLLPFCPAAGIVFKWLKDTVFAAEARKCAEENQNIYDTLCALAATAPAGAGGLTLLPYFSGSLQPKLLPEASGVFFGLTLSTGKAELVRAVLESIGFMLRENLELLRSLGVDAKRVHFFGGGSKNAFWNQMIADITGTELVLMEQNECGSMGAAMLAAVQMGDWETITEAQRCNRIAQIVHPNAQVHAVYEPFYRRYQQVFQCNEILFQKGTKSI